MLGFLPLEGEAATSLGRDMRTVNTYLREYGPLNGLIDSWVVFAVDDVRSSVLRWRLEAEQRMRAVRGKGLSDEQVMALILVYRNQLNGAKVTDFVGRFLPAYDAYTPLLYGSGPQRQASATVFKVIDVSRVLLPSVFGNSGRCRLKSLPDIYGLHVVCDRRSSWDNCQANELHCRSSSIVSKWEKLKRRIAPLIRKECVNYLKFNYSVHNFMA